MSLVSGFPNTGLFLDESGDVFKQSIGAIIDYSVILVLPLGDKVVWEMMNNPFQVCRYADLLFVFTL